MKKANANMTIFSEHKILPFPFLYWVSTSSTSSCKRIPAPGLKGGGGGGTCIQETWLGMGGGGWWDRGWVGWCSRGGRVGGGWVGGGGVEGGAGGGGVSGVLVRDFVGDGGRLGGGVGDGVLSGW